MEEARIAFDVTDGLEQFLREEPTIEEEDDIAELVVSKGKTTREAALMYGAARAAGVVPEHILDFDRAWWMVGGAANVGRIVQKYREEVELPNGRTVESRTYIGKPGRKPGERDDDEEPASEDGGSYVKAASKRGVELATKYIFGSVLSNLWSRLVQIAGAGDDVDEIIDRFIAEVEEMRAKLT
jgi:hypothetical protein